jgi:hypothetical protein
MSQQNKIDKLKWQLEQKYQIDFFSYFISYVDGSI